MDYLQYKIFIVPLAALIGFIFDLILGDPRHFPHPVRFIGKLSQFIEKKLYNLNTDKKISGTIFAVIIILLTWLISAALIFAASLLYMANRYLGILAVLLFSSFLVYTSLAIKDLKVECMKVYYDLKCNDLKQARKSLSMIVGRDTDRLDKNNIIRATVETIAENCVDGILSPMFYAFLGGPALALAFKASSTLDSMYGHKNKRYIRFGWASAKIDDWANYIPARLSIILLPAAAIFLKKGFRLSFDAVKKYRKNSPSPNSGIPESAVAGALGLRLGGETSYKGVTQIKPFIGEKRKDFQLEDIKDALSIIYVFSFISMVAGLVLHILFSVLLFYIFQDLYF